VKPETTRGARRLVPRRRRDRRRVDPIGLHGDPGAEARAAADNLDFDPAEFAEFLEADDETISADPAFRERLRDELWGMVRSQADRRRPAAPVSPILDPNRRR
jgi:hypothetical protein